MTAGTKGRSWPAGRISIGPRLTCVLVIVLLGALALQVLPAAFEKSGVCDEHGAHLPAGYVYWMTGVFSGGVNNPPLMQLVTAAPLALGGFDYCPFSDKGIWAARLPVIVLSLALGFAVFAWAGSLYGRAAGLAALFLFCFEPNVLAHSGLATLDLGVAAFLFWAFFFLWRSFRSGGRADRIMACAAMSAALLSKFTAVFLLPVFLLLLGVVLARRGSVASRAGKVILGLVFFGALFVAASHALYHMPGVSGEGRRAAEISASAHASRLSTGSEVSDGSAIARAAGFLLPDLYVDGALGKLRHSAGGHFAYLMGKRSLEGWWYYFPAALALKTPLPFLAAFLLSLFLGLSGRLRPAGADYAFLLLPLFCYVCAMAWTGVNIGVRHVLLFYPFGAVIASALLACDLRRRRILVALCLLGGAWHLVGTVRIHPHYLAYFNEIAGGPEGGSRYLIDSNVDWGQDDKLLVKFIADEPDTVLVNPGPYAPSVGTIAVNVNSLRGILRGDDTAYEWLRPFEPEKTLGFTWYVYRLSAVDFERAASESPSEAERRFWHAIALRKEGRLDEGLSELREIARDFPYLGVRAWLNSGRWLIEAGRHQGAIEAFRKALAAGGGSEAEMWLDAAAIEAERARGAATADELRWLAGRYAQRGDVPTALEILRSSVDASPEDASARLALARLLGTQGRYEEAAAAAEKAAEVAEDPGQALRVADEARNYAALRDAAVDEPGGRARGGEVAPEDTAGDEARRRVDVEDVAARFEAHVILAQIDSRYGRPASAARHYWRAFNLNPAFGATLAAMGEIVVRAKLGALKLETEWPSCEPRRSER